MLTFLCLGLFFGVSSASTLFVSHGGANDGTIPKAGEIGMIDTVTKVYTTLTTLTGYSFTSLAYDGSKLVLYRTAAGGGGNLPGSYVFVDPISGLSAGPDVPAVTGGGGVGSPLTDLVYDPATSKFFGTDSGIQYVEVNPATGAKTIILSAMATSASRNTATYPCSAFVSIALVNGEIYATCQANAQQGYSTSVTTELMVLDKNTGRFRNQKNLFRCIS